MQVTGFEDEIVSVKVAGITACICSRIRTLHEARFCVCRFALRYGKPNRLRADLTRAQVFVPQSPGAGHDANHDEDARGSIESFEPAPGRLYVVDIVGGPSRVRVFDREGHPLPAPSLPPVASVDNVVSMALATYCSTSVPISSPAPGIVLMLPRRVHPHSALAGCPL